MARPDLNLLITLDVLLTEASVTRAGQKLGLSPSAMSRALSRLRDTLGDPLLVRAGRSLVPTPRALELANEVRRVVQDAEAVLRPTKLLDLRRLSRTFTLRTSDGFAESFGPALLQRVRAEAPNVRLRFIRKLDRDSAPLRDGSVDLETGVVGTVISPEVRAQPLFRDYFVGLVREGHDLARADVTVSRYGDQEHVVVGGRGSVGHVARALKDLGVDRKIVAEVDGYSAACALVRKTDLVATVPARHTAGLRGGMHMFELPFEVPKVMISLMWHPRMDGDPAHRWIRDCTGSVCRSPTLQDKAVVAPQL